jgi:hypothetical protein
MNVCGGYYHWIFLYIDPFSERHTILHCYPFLVSKFGTCTVVSINGTLVEAKMFTFTLESTHFIFNYCPIYPHDDASAKFSTNSQETDYRVLEICIQLTWKEC